MLYEKVSITGTPGTGKTAVSNALVEKIEHELVDVNRVVHDSGEVEYDEDTERNTLTVDINSLRNVLEKQVQGKTVLEGHLSHHFDSDLFIVLRCGPEELEERMEKKGWDDEKIRENLESEVIDLLLQEVLNIHDFEKVVEYDTTGKEPDEVAEELKEIIEGEKSLKNYRPGQVEWSEDHLYS